MADSTLDVDLNLEPAAFSTAWTNYLVTKVTQGPYTVASHAATRHLGPVQNFVENCLLELQKKTSANIFSAREFGATGDGVADDTAELQAALDAANTMGGGTVYLGAGTFKVSTPLAIYDGTQLVGAGSAATTIAYTGVDYAIVQDTPETRIYGVLLQGFKLTFGSGGLDMNSVSNSRFVDLHLQALVAGTGTCMRLVSTLTDKAMENTILSCQFEDGEYGLVLGPLGAGRNRVIACVFDTCDYGVRVNDADFNMIHGCVFDCTGDTLAAVYLSESGAGLSDGNSIESCYFTGAATRYININTAGLDHTRVIGNHFQGTAANADINNGTGTVAFGNTPLAAPWGVLYSDEFAVDETGAFDITGDIIPATDSTYDLGSNANRWAEGYIDALTVTDSLTMGGNIVSDTDSTDTLGTDAVRWLNTFSDTFTGTSLRLGGATGTASIAAAGSSGIVLATDVTTDNTNKFGRFFVPAYVNAQSPVACFFAAAGSTANTIYFGGGTGLGQAGTNLRFYTTPTVNTVTGTLRWEMTSTGHWVPGATATYDIGTTSTYMRTLYANSARLQDVTTDATNKVSLVTTGSYDNAHAAVVLFRGSSESSQNWLYIGGNASEVAPTQIRFTTASAVNTNGAVRWTISAFGHLVPGATATYDIGSTTTYVRNIYTGGLYRGYRDVSADGALSIATSDSFITLNTTSGTKTATMTATSAGHIIEVRCIVASGGQYNLGCTLDGTAGTLTFDAAGEYAKLVYTGAVWRVMDYTGATFA